MNSQTRNLDKFNPMPKSLLVIDPLPTHRIRLAAILEAAQYDVTAVASIAEVAQLAVTCRPDLVLLGLHDVSPASSLDGLRAAGIGPDVSVFCLDTVLTPERRLQALQAGARELMPLVLPDTLLLARVRSLIREGDAARECERRRVTATSFGFAEAHRPFALPSQVVCVASPEMAIDLAAKLRTALPHNLEFLSLEDALRDDSFGAEPDAYLIASDDRGHALEDTLPELRVRNHSRHAPVLVIHRADDPRLAARALNMGASDVAADTASGEELAIRIEKMLRFKRLQDSLRKTDEQSYRLAATDPLTGLYNRRYADSYLADLLMRQKDHGRGYVLMLVDLDHFKLINDTHGHGAGDLVLCEVANRLRDNLRAGDLVARYGGEEFLVVLPDTDATEGELTARRLCKAIGAARYVLESRESIAVTASIGVSFGIDPTRSEVVLKTGTFDVIEPAVGSSMGQLINAADAALYRAKNAGRNRVEFSAV